MSEKVKVISVQKGPLEGGGTYSSLWAEPLEWEDREAPHLTRGPVPFKIDCAVSVVDDLASVPLPCICELQAGMKIASGNKAKPYVTSAKVLEASKPVVVPAHQKAAG